MPTDQAALTRKIVTLAPAFTQSTSSPTTSSDPTFMTLIPDNTHEGQDIPPVFVSLYNFIAEKLSNIPLWMQWVIFGCSGLLIFHKLFMSVLDNWRTWSNILVTTRKNAEDIRLLRAKADLEEANALTLKASARQDEENARILAAKADLEEANARILKTNAEQEEAKARLSKANADLEEAKARDSIRSSKANADLEEAKARLWKANADQEEAKARLLIANAELE